MALFKIAKGNEANLPTTKTDGHMWYTKDKSKLYVDSTDDKGNLQRKAINAADSETLNGAALTEVIDANEGSDVNTVPTSKAVTSAINTHAKSTSSVHLTAEEKSAFDAIPTTYVNKSGDTMTGKLTIGSASIETNGYVNSTWLKTTAAGDSRSVATKIAIIKDGWIYYRTPEEILGDIGASGYGTCSTAAGTAAKTVTCDGLTLRTSSTFSVKFTNTVQANATLNVNSIGAKPIYYKGKAITAEIIKAGDTATFLYDGTHFVLTAVDNVYTSGDEVSY